MIPTTKRMTTRGRPAVMAISSSGAQPPTRKPKDAPAVVRSENTAVRFVQEMRTPEHFLSIVVKIAAKDAS